MGWEGSMKRKNDVRFVIMCFDINTIPFPAQSVRRKYADTTSDDGEHDGGGAIYPLPCCGMITSLQSHTTVPTRRHEKSGCVQKCKICEISSPLPKFEKPTAGIRARDTQ